MTVSHSQPMCETYELDHMLSCLRERVDDKLCLDAASEIIALKARITELEDALREITQECFDDGGATKEAKMAHRALQPKAKT